jgi:hypothetical protein
MPRGDDPGYSDLRSIALDCRTFTLQNLDEWPQAELALRQARDFAQRTGPHGSRDMGYCGGAALLARPVG